MITIVFIMFLIFIPMFMFTIVKRAISIFRFAPYLMREVIVPQMKRAAEEGEGFYDEEGNHHKIKLSPEQIRIIENSVLTSSLEINPKRFSKKMKKRFAITGTIIGLIILAFILYKVFWFVYDFVVLTFF